MSLILLGDVVIGISLRSPSSRASLIRAAICAPDLELLDLGPQVGDPLLGDRLTAWLFGRSCHRLERGTQDSNLESPTLEAGALSSLASAPDPTILES